MKALMIASGQEPGRGLLKKHVADADMIVAIDGGLKPLHQYGVIPQLIVGDMDSIPRELLKEYQEKGCELLTAPAEKNETDALLALDEVTARGGKEIVFLGATGGRIDHLLSNLMLLKRAYDRGVRVWIEDELQEIGLYKGSFEIFGEIGQTVSIIPMNEEAVVNAAGVYYPLVNLELRNDKPRGVSNILTQECAQIHSTDFVFIMKDKKIKK